MDRPGYRAELEDSEYLAVSERTREIDVQNDAHRNTYCVFSVLGSGKKI